MPRWLSITAACLTVSKSKKFLAKQPKAQRSFRTAAQSSEGEFICWQFSIMDMDNASPFSFAALNADKWLVLLEQAKKWESMTWGEIEDRRNHAIAVNKLSPEARARLEELKLDDIDEVFSLRLTGRERVIGIRDRNIFRVLWWDAEHKVCPSHKKHT